MGFLSFSSVSFLIAGSVCAAGPVLIHLLNRRRHRVVKWGAMDFLRQAMKQNRKVLEWRDFLLLAMRTLAVLLFGTALARPFLAQQQAATDVRQPLHAVLIVDNSLSMSYETLEGSLLDQAKRKSREFIELLPRGSRVTVIPACGSREFISSEALENVEAAREALGRIEIVDRSASLTRVIELARVACEASPEFAKRVVFIGDQQELTWQKPITAELQNDLPTIQCVVVRPAESENSWVSDVRVPDGLADVETTTTIVVEVSHQGNSPRRDLQVTLASGETVLGQQTVNVEPGGTREVTFECVLGGLGATPEPGQVSFLPLTAKIGPDRLAADDQRVLAVPVVAALNVVFIDQYAEGHEDVARGRLGETRHLRKLLAPNSGRSDAPRQPIKVRHLAAEMVDRETLADARLVVVAGLDQPELLVPILADYVQAGGQLLIAAGADFDAAAWNGAAWRGGQGILPLPLKPEPIGVTPDEAPEKLAPFQLSFASFADEPIFRLAGLSRSDLQSLYAEPFFFKAVAVDESAEALAAVKASEEVRVENEQSRDMDDGETPWLKWAAEDFKGSEKGKTTQLPRVLARYDGPGTPAFLVSREMGRGRVLFCTSGVLSPWNTLPKTNAVLLFDRLMREMIENTLPECNFTPNERLTLPLPRAEQHLAVSLLRPSAALEEPLDVMYVSAARRGVVVNGLLSRGIYQVTGRRLGGMTADGKQPAIWNVPLAVNGEADESDLTPLTRSKFVDLTKGNNLGWVAAGEELALAGAVVNGQGTWWWTVLGVVGLLAGEMVVAGVGGQRIAAEKQFVAQPKSISSRPAQQRSVAIS